MKLLKTSDNEKILKASRGKKAHITYRGTKARMRAYVLLGTMQDRRQWSIFKALKETKQNCPLRILYPEKISFKNENKMKAFSAIQKLREFIASRPALRNVKRTPSVRWKIYQSAILIT